MQTILITGSHGFVGKRAVKFFQGRYRVAAPSHAEMDITDPASVRRYMEALRPEYVLHCAAVSDVGQCQRQPERSWEINVSGSVHVVKAAKTLGAKCLLCSSDQVYFGSPLQSPHQETEPLSPANAYGRQKLEMERRCLAIDPQCVLLRLSWMYDLQKAEPGEKDTFFTRLTADLAAGGPLVFRVYDRRGITDVNHVLENMEKAFSLPGGVYNFGSPNALSTPDTVKAAFRAANLEWRGKIREDREAFASSPRNLTMDPRKLEKAGIFFPSTAEGLAQALAAWKAAGR